MRALPPGEPSRPRLLWILPRWPLPAADGARVANVNLLRGLAALGVSIDLVAVAEPSAGHDPEELKKVCGVASVRVVPRGPNGRGFSPLGVLAALGSFGLKPWLPVTLAPFAARGVRAELELLLSRGPAEGKWSAVVYDGLHPAAHSASFGRFEPPVPGLPVVYRAHNVEAEIWRRKALVTTFLPLRLFFLYQAALMARFESSVARSAAAVLGVSEKDFETFRGAVPGVKGGTAPIGFDFDGPAAPEAPTPGLRVLFLGKLDWLPNREGLLWFLERVWPEARKRRPDLELWIAGSGDAGWLKGRADLPGVRFWGRVERVDELYRDCGVSIVPIFYGSGTRVKAIESSRFARPCLSTELGVEGLGLTDGATYFRAESEEEWIGALVGMDPGRARTVGANAREFLKSTYHLPFAARTFLERLGAVA